MRTNTEDERWRFGRHDRIVIQGQAYRPVGKDRRSHMLQLVVDDVVNADNYIIKDDAEISALMQRGLFRHDPGYFSRVQASIRSRRDNSDLTDLTEAELNTVLWKAQWCLRFELRRAEMNAPWRPTMSLKDLAKFVDSEKISLHRWYIDKFNERRPLGREKHGEPRKEFDYPSASTLRGWLLSWSAGDQKLEVFRPKYYLCGNRDQLDPRAKSIVDACVENYASSLRPLQRDIYEDVEAKLQKKNATLPAGEKPIYVSKNAVRRRIKKIDPFSRDFNRLGKDRALRKFMPIGRGLTSVKFLERVEIDDWCTNLHSLIISSALWKTIDKRKRKWVPRVRCTATVAIDVASRSIVGFNLTQNPPSTASAKTALRRVLCDKTELAKEARAKSDWPMHGLPLLVATDGGSAFLGEFERSIVRSGMTRLLPEMDPRKRGTIESFFRIFKRLCRYFAGQAFSSVVEKADYPSEDMASLTVEMFRKEAIRFIVDSYHHRSHRGLGGATPYSTWERLAKDGVSPPPSEATLRAAFGIETSRKLGKHGITYLDLAYNSAELNDLFRRHENKPVQVLIDPMDLGSVLVRVPDKNGARNLGGSDYLQVPCVDERASGKTLDGYLLSRKNLAAVAKDDETRGLLFRLEAHEALTETAERARREAGLAEFRATQIEYEKAAKVIFQNTRSALGRPDQGSPQPVDNIPGREVAISKRQRPGRRSDITSPNSQSGETAREQSPQPSDDLIRTRQPFGGSLNLGEGDKE